ncbi:class I SAM-dependent methyltransferase [Nocardia xishanensis]
MGDARFGWFADAMDLRATDRVLEIGPGSSPSLSLLAERVTDGRVVGVERSATAIARAAQRLGIPPAAQANSGRVGLVHADLARLLPDQVLDGIDGFDKILAVNVNVFWTKRPTAELAVVRKLLAPGGGLYLCYGYGDPDGAPTSAKPPPGRLEERLTEAGFTVRTLASGDLLCVHAVLD